MGMRVKCGTTLSKLNSFCFKTEKQGIHSSLNDRRKMRALRTVELGTKPTAF